MRTFSILPLILFFLVGCDSYVDDQSLMTDKQWELVNPKPQGSDFRLNNSRHKVIVAILDSGIDYNHPYLKKNIHFTLDENDSPIAAGWDYLGSDPWPAPYIARTDDINPAIAEVERLEGQKDREFFETLVALFPSLRKTIFPDRSIREEIEETISHGTHVAGLASFDSEEIGIRGYRVLPYSRLSKDSDQAKLLFKTFTTTLLQGIGDAIQDGARVLNMSLGVLSNQVGQEEFKRFQNDLIAIVDENPEVFFVVAAGNEGEILDGEKKMSLPCYIPRKNVICVGALDERLNPTEFSNIILKDDISMVFAWGDEVLSTIPSNFCPEDFSLMDDLEELGKFLEKKCSTPPLFQKMSGTSMASPLVAREIAKIMAEHPLKTTDEVREVLYGRTLPQDFSGRMISKLPITKPSWYQIKGLKIPEASLMRQSLMKN